MVLGSYYLTYRPLGQRRETSAQTTGVCADDATSTSQTIVERTSPERADADDGERARSTHLQAVHMYASEDEAMHGLQRPRSSAPTAPIRVRADEGASDGTMSYTDRRQRPSAASSSTSNIPQDLGFVDRRTASPSTICDYEITFTCGKKQLGKIVDRTIKKHGFTVAAEVLDDIKATGYHILHHRRHHHLHRGYDHPRREVRPSSPRPSSASWTSKTSTRWAS